jgi:hypothetical protein
MFLFLPSSPHAAAKQQQVFLSDWGCATKVGEVVHFSGALQ